MRLLLDTHALLWWLYDDPRLGSHARTLIADSSNKVLFSAVSLWEIVVKARVGKLKLEAGIGAIELELVSASFERLTIMPTHLATLATLPSHHKDPFDHLLIAQAIAENAVFMSDDRHMPLYPVQLQRCSGS